MMQELTKETAETASLQRRLSAYSTLAVAGACAVASAPKAEAAIVYSGSLNDSVAQTSIGSYFNLTSFAFNTSYAAVNGGDATAPALNLWGTTTTYAYLYPGTTTVNRFVANTAGATLELSVGTPIGPTSTFGTTRSGPTGGIIANSGWTANTTGYFGVQFLSGANTYYGWVYAFVSGTPSTTPTVIYGAAFNNVPNQPILAGQVPEPGTVGCLAAGVIGAGALAWRRRKVAA